MIQSIAFLAYAVSDIKTASMLVNAALAYSRAK